MRKNLNEATIEGRLYEHDLELKTVKNTASANFGKPFIGGSVSIATDEEGINIVKVNYTYVTEFTKAGKASSTYTILKKIIDSNKSWVNVGKDQAMRLNCSTALGLNDFWSTRDNQFVSAVQCSGGFIKEVSVLGKEEARNSFAVDMLISSTIFKDADEEKGTPNTLMLKGYIFDFRNAILPVTFPIIDPDGIKFFEDKDISAENPFYGKVWGQILSSTIVKEVEEKSAFGSSSHVKSSETRRREYLVTGCPGIDYGFDEEGSITIEELKKALADREVYLATIKKNAEDYAASQQSATPTSGFGTVSTPTSNPVAGMTVPTGVMPLF